MAFGSVRILTDAAAQTKETFGPLGSAVSPWSVEQWAEIGARSRTRGTRAAERPGRGRDERTPCTCPCQALHAGRRDQRPVQRVRERLRDRRELYVTAVNEQSSNAASIFPSFITNRTNQMAIDLVQYFNSLPLKLPYFNAPPHTPNNRGAIQNYVYGAVAGGGTTSLQQSLLAIPLPTTAGSDLQIYNATVASAIKQSRIQTLNGVSQIYAGQLRVSTPSPNNRYGANESGTVPAYILAQP